MHPISIAVWVFLAFAIIGMIAVSAAATKALLGGSTISIWHVRFLDETFVVTRPLLVLSALFGCIAALTFAANLQDRDSLDHFLNFALASYRRSFAVLCYYLGAIVDLQRKLSWNYVTIELERNNRTAILELLKNILLRSDPRIVTTILELARRNSLTGWGGYQGL